MRFLCRNLPKHHRQHHGGRSYHRSTVDLESIKHLRDRGLDHVVQRERHLKPMINIKNLIKAEPSKTLPLSVITKDKDNLGIPIRPIEFIRKYPSIFQEIMPAGITVHPHIKLTQQVLDIDAQEDLLYESESYLKNLADRVLKLLMISRIVKIPLQILDYLIFDLGLPKTYVKCLVPEFPDCFHVTGNKEDMGLELVCWSNDLAVSFLEKKAVTGKIEYVKGMPLAFPMQFSKSFEMDKPLKKWYADWQKLPYVSPYENATHLGPSTDESDKWAVGVLHEMLNIFVSKSLEKDTLLRLGEWLGIRSRFKRALLHHPGIFYLSNKMGTCTVVLRESYNRGLLIGKCPMANVRNQYVHLMNKVTEDRKAVSVPGESKLQEKKTAQESKDQGEIDNHEGSVKANDMDSDLEEDDENEYADDEEEEGRRKTHSRRKLATNRSRMNKKKNFNARESSSIDGRERLVQKRRGMTKGEGLPKDASRTEMKKRHKGSGDSLTSPTRKGKLYTAKRTAT